MSSELRPGSEDCFEDDDGFPAAPGGKKRKVPAFGQGGKGTEATAVAVDDDDVDADDDKTPAPAFVLPHRFPRTHAHSLCEFRKGLFLRRKAAFIALYIDAQTAINASALKSKSTLPDVTSFEKLLPSLEDVGVNSWTPDRPGWREDRAEEWPYSRLKRKRAAAAAVKKVERKGWAPEGSFEFEKECKASASMRARAREQAALLKLAYELRGVVLATSKPLPPVLKAPPVASAAQAEDKPPSKNKRKLDKKAEQKAAPAPPASSSAASAPAQGTSTPAPALASTPMTQASSKDTDAVKGKKKPKKKKRSVLANQSNPHHVDNYRSSRAVSPQGDPYEPYPSHLDLIAPPPMHFLAARPQRVTAPLPGAPTPRTVVRPSEDDYLCCFCEYDLYYGSEKARRRAVRRRRQELKRKEAIKTKAKNVAEGRGTVKEETDGEDDEDDEAEVEGECDDDGHGRCTCGRAVGQQRPVQTDAG
ncbi:hypothetical protein IAT38_002334 [Cryptococcus sp. DSM 104549]